MKLSASLLLTDILPGKRRLINKVIKNKIFHNNTHIDVFTALTKAGVEGIELFVNSHTTFTDIEEVREVLKEHRMPVLSLHQPLRFVTKTNLSEVVRLFKMADLLSAKVIVLHLNSAGKQIFGKDYIEILHSLEQKYGIMIGFENMEKHIGSLHRPHTWNMDKYASLLEKAGFRMTFDTTHLAMTGGDIVDFFRRNKTRIINIHLSDYKNHRFNKSLRPTAGKHLPLGKGELPIREFIKALNEEKYKGLVTLEIHGDLESICRSAGICKEI